MGDKLTDDELLGSIAAGVLREELDVDPEPAPAPEPPVGEPK